MGFIERLKLAWRFVFPKEICPKCKTRETGKYRDICFSCEDKMLGLD